MKLNFKSNPALDAAAIAALRTSVGWESLPDRIREAAGRAYFRAACFDGGLLVGYVEAVSDRIDDAYIRNLIVHPGYQGRGIGSRLLEMVVKQTRDDGIKMVNVLFDPALDPFYRKAGFTIIAGGLIDNKKEE